MEEAKRYTFLLYTSSKEEVKKSKEKKSESQRIVEMPVNSDSLEEITNLIDQACDRILIFH
jgi:flagellar basal body-associated protein FliL